MTEDNDFPRIKTDVENTPDNPDFTQFIRHNLQKALPKDFFNNSSEEQKIYLNSSLPRIVHSEYKTTPSNISFYLLSRLRTNAFKFFFEMISRWLIPGKRKNCSLVSFTLNTVTSF